MRELLKVSVFFLLLSACGERSSKESRVYGLVEDPEKLIIPLDSKTAYITTCMAYFEDRGSANPKRYLTYLASNIPAIHFFDIDKRQIDFSVSMQEEWPNGVGRLGGFKVIDRDSIIVVSGYDRKISYVNSKGKIIKSCNLLKSGQIPDSGSGMPVSFTINPLNIFKDKIYLNVAPDRNFWIPSYYDGETMMEFDFENCNYRYFNSYPLAMKGAVWGSGIYSTARSKYEELVFSFPSDHNVQVYDLEKDTSRDFFAKSSYINKIEPLENPGIETHEEYVFTTPSYGAIIHDPYRKVYYRIARHGLSEKLEESQIHDQSFSILILDERFNPLGETLFPGKRYVSNIYFLTPEGLYISNNKDKNPDLKEDQLSFTLLRLEEENK